MSQEEADFRKSHDADNFYEAMRLADSLIWLAAEGLRQKEERRIVRPQRIFCKAFSLDSEETLKDPNQKPLDLAHAQVLRNALSQTGYSSFIGIDKEIPKDSLPPADAKPVNLLIFGKNEQHISYAIGEIKKSMGWHYNHVPFPED